MPYTNPYFNSVYPGQTAEQGLIDDLVREQIKIYGVDILYMPRRHMNLDLLLHESTKVAFEMAMPIPMYLKTVDGFDNGMEMLSKFGVRSSDEVTFVCSRSEFTTYYAPYLQSYYNSINGNPPGTPLDHLIGEIDSRPKEGDLLFFPFDNSIFEIKYCQFDQPFFQLGRGYVFEMQCEKFEYSGETFSTGYDRVDDPHTEDDYYRIEFELHSSNSTGTFEKYEPVIIYDITGTNPHDLLDERGRHILNEDYSFVMAEDIINDAEVIMGAEQGVDIATNARRATGPVIADEDELDLATDPKEHNLFSEKILDEKDELQGALIMFDNNDVFRLYKDPGFLNVVYDVKGKVMDWDRPAEKLVVGELSDLDPTQEQDLYNPVDDRWKDVTLNKFDTVIIIGQKSGAYWIAHKAGTRRKAFDDETVIQKEFDSIKILDIGDENPFGFV